MFQQLDHSPCSSIDGQIINGKGGTLGFE